MEQEGGRDRQRVDCRAIQAYRARYQHVRLIPWRTEPRDQPKLRTPAGYTSCRNRKSVDVLDIDSQCFQVIRARLKLP